MTAQEAREILQKGCDGSEDSIIEYQTALGIADEALEKQTPKKVLDIEKSKTAEDIEVFGEDAKFGYCPKCNSLVSDLWNEIVCGDCGQKLNWD